MSSFERIMKGLDNVEVFVQTVEIKIREKIAKEFENDQSGRVVWGTADIANAIRNPEYHKNNTSFGSYPKPTEEGPNEGQKTNGRCAE